MKRLEAIKAHFSPMGVITFTPVKRIGLCYHRYHMNRGVTLNHVYGFDGKFKRLLLQGQTHENLDGTWKIVKSAKRNPKDFQYFVNYRIYLKGGDIMKRVVYYEQD